MQSIEVPFFQTDSETGQTGMGYLKKGSIVIIVSYFFSLVSAIMVVISYSDYFRLLSIAENFISYLAFIIGLFGMVIFICGLKDLPAVLPNNLGKRLRMARLFLTLAIILEVFLEVSYYTLGLYNILYERPLIIFLSIRLFTMLFLMISFLFLSFLLKSLKNFGFTTRLLISPFLLIISLIGWIIIAVIRGISLFAENGVGEGIWSFSEITLKVYLIITPIFVLASFIELYFVLRVLTIDFERFRSPIKENTIKEQRVSNNNVGIKLVRIKVGFSYVILSLITLGVFAIEFLLLDYLTFDNKMSFDIYQTYLIGTLSLSQVFRLLGGAFILLGFFEVSRLFPKGLQNRLRITSVLLLQAIVTNLLGNNGLQIIITGFDLLINDLFLINFLFLEIYSTGIFILFVIILNYSSLKAMNWSYKTGFLFLLFLLITSWFGLITALVLFFIMTYSIFLLMFPLTLIAIGLFSIVVTAVTYNCLKLVIRDKSIFSHINQVINGKEHNYDSGGL